MNLNLDKTIPLSEPWWIQSDENISKLVKSFEDDLYKILNKSVGLNSGGVDSSTNAASPDTHVPNQVRGNCNGDFRFAVS